MSTEAALAARIAADPEDADAVRKYVAMLLAAGRGVPLPVEELSLRGHLRDDPARHDLAFRLATVLQQQGKPVPPEVEEGSLWHCLAQEAGRHDLMFRLADVLLMQGKPVPPVIEEGSLRHGMRLEPGRLDLAERFGIVALEGVLAAQREDAAPAATEADGAILARARARLAEALTDPRAGLPAHDGRWGEFQARMHAAIAGFGSPVEALRYAQRHVNFEHRVPAGEGLKYHGLYLRELASEFPAQAARLPGLDDPPQSRPETQFPIAGRMMSNIVPYLARIILTCATTIPAPRTVLELGGGYGAPARAWLTNPFARAERVIVADIAESLFFAECLLSATFGAEAVHYVDSAAPLDPALLARHKVILCPIERMAALEALPVDLVVNTGSLQEMSEAWVDHYMAWLDRQQARFFYSLNYAAQPVGHLAESVNLWSPRPSPAWMARLLRWNPGFMRMQSERNFLEAIYEKTPAALAPEEALARLALLAERALDGAAFVEAMDLFRRCRRPEVAQAILRRVAAEMAFHPKEALFLAEWLEAEGAATPETSALRARLAAEREAGIEGTT
jgi:hypothetical protein